MKNTKPHSNADKATSGALRTASSIRVHRLSLTLTALATAAFLAACGGGGGGSSTGTGTGTVTPGPVVVTPAPTPGPASTIVTSVPAATYAPTDPAGGAYALLNAERARCGFGLLAQNAALDVSTAAHAKYSVANDHLGHEEDPTKPSFYGATIEDRIKRAGYAMAVGTEAGAFTYLSGDVRQMDDITPIDGGIKAIRRLLSAPYHAKGLLDGYVDVGMATNTYAFYANLGALSREAFQVNPELHTYPCEGSTETLVNYQLESPSPFPNDPDQTWGQPIMIFGSKDLIVGSASITGPVGSVAIRAIYGPGQKKDPNGAFVVSGNTASAAVIPTSTLTTNTRYTVTISGGNNGATFTRTFSFTTGSRSK
jgi:uncharacterized protein YkwD